MSARLLPALLLLLGGCATDKLTLLEDENGTTAGMVAVMPLRGGEVLVDQPRTEVALRSGPARVRPVRSLDPAYADLLGSLPPPAKTFTIRFPFEESRIPADQMAILTEIKLELKDRAGAQIEVAGFTDSVGAEGLNDEISRRRAEAVAQELRDAGLVIEVGDAVGRGEYDARATLGDERADPAFRKVDVIVR